VPIGAKAVIDVREMDEVQPIEFPDMTGAAEERITRCERAAERLVGVTDVAAGVTQNEKRTLGEVNTTLEQSFVRIDEAKANIQETLEEIAQVRHIMWKRALAEMGEEGMEAPPSVQQSLMLRGALQGPGAEMAQPLPNLHGPMSVIGLEERQPDVSTVMPNLRFTVEMMEGVFRFKPKGSVETADKNKLRIDFNQSMQAIGGLSQTNPMIAAILQTLPAAKALLEQWVRLYHVSDKQAFLGSEAMQAMQRAQMMQQMMMQGGPPGAPPPGQPPPGAPPA